MRLRQRISTDHLAGGKLWEVLLLLFFGAEEYKRESAYVHVCALCSGKRSLERELFSNHRRTDLLETKPAVVFRYVDREQTELAGLAHQLAGDRPVLCVDVVFARDDFLAQKFFGCLSEHALFFGYIFRDKDVFGRAVFNQETATLWRVRLSWLARH